MLFNSLDFLIFLPILFILHWIIPQKYRWLILLAGSYYFYLSWDVSLGFLIVGTTVVSYASALIIEKYGDKRIKLAALLVSIISSLFVLFFYKYFDFASNSVTSFLRFCGVSVDSFTLNLVLPVGISFYTFQTLSYTIDVYRGDTTAEKHLGYYALFVVFFPQLVAGPIERPTNLLPQLKEKRTLKGEDISEGLRYILMGFFKKIVIADTLGVFVTAVYSAPSEANGLTALIATTFFAVQILCDFDGYTNIAIGAARLFGIKLMKNFNHPYSAVSIKDFWSRWHISLSTWFKDYLYIPLGGNRRKLPRQLLNVFIVFLLSGLWHGANWTFVVWGALHGLYQIVGKLTAKRRKELCNKLRIDTSSDGWNFVRRMLTFALVCFAWIFFRANNLSDAGILISKLFTGWSISSSFVDQAFTYMNLTPSMLVFVVAALVCLWFGDRAFIDKEFALLNSTGNTADTLSVCVVRSALYAVFLTIIVCVWIYNVAETGAGNAFIYFQF